MTSPATIPMTDLLTELEPAVERGLEQHLAAAVEWFPHEYVPYEEGRNFAEEPWQASDSRLAEIAQTSLELNLLTEDNLPFYLLALWELFGGKGAWGEWSRRWTAEEGRHAIVLRDYLTVTRGLDPIALERARMDQVCRGFHPGWVKAGPLDGVVYATVQELATRIAHRNTGVLTGEASLQKLTGRIAQDENLHYVFYRDLGAAALEIEPSEMVLSIARQVIGFAMPGLDVPGYKERTRRMADAGVYDLRIHRDQVLGPVLMTHWRLNELTGLSPDAEIARDRILAYLQKMSRSAARFEESKGERQERSHQEPLLVAAGVGD